MPISSSPAAHVRLLCALHGASCPDGMASCISLVVCIGAHLQPEQAHQGQDTFAGFAHVLICRPTLTQLSPELQVAALLQRGEAAHLLIVLSAFCQKFCMKVSSEVPALQHHPACKHCRTMPAEVQMLIWTESCDLVMVGRCLCCHMPGYGRAHL